jgi:molybdopterin biosynthesis enzyme MoaB
VVTTTGGAEFTGRDAAPQALKPLFERRMGGLSESLQRIPTTGSAPRRSSASD